MVLGREANMQIEKQVCSLELSKQLKECGYKQEGLWLWVENSKDGTIRLWFQEAAEIEFNSYKNASFSKWKKQNTTMFDTCRVYSAPTATELLDRLPEYIRVKKYGSSFVVKWDRKDSNVPAIGEDKCANALAEMYIYLQKEGLI